MAAVIAWSHRSHLVRGGATLVGVIQSSAGWRSETQVHRRIQHHLISLTVLDHDGQVSRQTACYFRRREDRDDEGSTRFPRTHQAAVRRRSRRGQQHDQQDGRADDSRPIRVHIAIPRICIG